MKDYNEVFDIISKERKDLFAKLKEKKELQQQEYEEIKKFSELTKSKYKEYYDNINNEIKNINDVMIQYQDDLLLGGFIDIQKFANDVSSLMSKNTNYEWEILAIAFTYKKRQKGVFGLQLINTDANIICIAKKDIFSKDLTDIIFKQKDWLNNNNAMLAFLEHVKRGDVILLHIVEAENDKEKLLNLFESGFNGDFDRYLLRFDLAYNDKNPVNKYPFLQDYLDNYVLNKLLDKK